MKKKLLMAILLFGITVTASAQKTSKWISTVGIEGMATNSPSAELSYLFGKQSILIDSTHNGKIAVQAGLGVRRYFMSKNELGSSPYFISYKARGIASDIGKAHLGIHFTMELRQGTYLMYKDVTSTKFEPLKDTRLMGSAGLNYTYRKLLIMANYYPKEYTPNDVIKRGYSPFGRDGFGLSANIVF
jgi:hypothetical protein